MSKIIFDGIEDEAFKHRIALKCQRCNSISRNDFNKVLKNSKSTNLKNNKSNFLYKYIFRCKNNHNNEFIYRFEEIQPSRYQIEQISSKHLGFEMKLKKIFSHIGVFLLLAIIPVTIIWLHTITYLNYSRYSYLRENGSSISATVIDRYGDAGGVKRVATYELTYQYTVQDNIYSDTKKVDQNTFVLSDIGSQINILYDKQNPQVSDVTSNEEIYFDLGLIAFVDLIIAITIIWIYKSSKNSTNKKNFKDAQ